MTLIKICGIKEEATLRGMAGQPIDYIGLMFAKKSRRLVTAEQAGQISAYARTVPMASGKPPRIVGVFVNPTMEELTETLDKAELDVVQLHGEETPAFAKSVAETFGVEVWRALPVTEDAGPERLAEYAGTVKAILIDTAGGGTGKTFRWDVIPAYQEEATKHGFGLFIAGGLNPDNAGELVLGYRPYGVDISSGVETDGVKDNGKIATFAERVKGS